MTEILIYEGILWLSIGLVSWFALEWWFRYIECRRAKLTINEFLRGIIICGIMGFCAPIVFIYFYNKEIKPEQERIRENTPWYLLKEFGGTV